MKSYEEVKLILSEIEPTEAMYEKLTQEDIPNLQKIIKDEAPWLASRAVFVLSKLNTPKATEILYSLLNDPRTEVRISLAASASALPLEASQHIVGKLANDSEVGVRKFAYLSVLPNATPDFKKQLRKIYDKEQEPYLQEMLREKIPGINE